jgi:hypothetical protein
MKTIRHLLSGLMLLWLMGTAGAQAPGRDFDHLRTGFALTGNHANARCESCHVGGVFKGTPRDCAACHTAGGRLARGNLVRPADHIPTAQACETCHNTRVFAGARVNHAGVARGSCATCHNGTQAPGKSANHLHTTASCDTCHATTAWRPATGFDHAGVAAGSCAGCHNGAQATGKGAGHTPYTAVGAVAPPPRASGHKAGFKSWTGARLHTGVSVTAQCATCHAATKPNTTVHAGQTLCENCHKSTGSWAAAKVDHASFNAATNCSSCHNGSGATGKPAAHVPVGATNCFGCHNVTGWKPSRFNHTQVPVTAQCASCHTGSFPPADGKPAGHAPYQLVASTAGANCDACHKAGYASWLPARLHSSVTMLAQCATCHAATKPSTPVHAGQTVCETCHKSTSSWAAARVDHANFTAATNCSSCHNGSGATGKPATHIPVGATNCFGCHNVTGWKPSRFNHTQVPVTAQCASCHNGAFAPADGRPAGHIPYALVTASAAANCDSCHKGGYTTWANGRFHANVTVTGQCKTCHSGSYVSQGAVAKPTNHIPEGQLLNGAAMECNACHTSTTAWTQRMNHNNSLGGGAGWCKACHVSGTNFLGGMEKKSLTHKTKSPPAIDCSESGCHRPLGNKGTTFSKWD